ncbi:MAG: isoaspartyl peptidase/L-asparaginase, partial [Vicinamibacterales bacterium]
MKRRDFVRAGAAAGIAAAAPRVLAGQAPPQDKSAAPTMLTPRSVKPVVVASSNGHRFKNGGDQTSVERAFSQMLKGGDLLDALIAGVNINELDPEDTSVGYGGLPNAEGIVQLDASVMHGPKKRAGAVGGLEGIRTPSLVAKAVMDQTDHHLLVGKDAQRFARGLGFTIEDDLNTERSRKAWLEWKRRIDPS